MIRNYIASLCLFILFFQTAIAQETKIKLKNKGTVYVSWGYNREVYSESDIRFKNTTTDNYDFVMVNARAKDHPGFNHGFIDFMSKDLTIPQYNCHIGYLFNDKRNLGIELSWDHLKYVVNDYATVHLKGNIRGNVIDKDTYVDRDFIHLQHTNGNNYLMVNLVKIYPIWQNKNFNFSLVEKVGAGPLVSYSISTILGNHNPGAFKIQGFVIGLNTAARLNFYKYLFIQPTLQYGFADYMATPLGADNMGRATHVFSSYCVMLEGGFNIPLQRR